MEASRRDFINLAIGGMGAIGALGALYPVVKTLAPSAASLASAKVEIDTSQLQDMQVRVTSWKGKPVFVVKLPEGFSESYDVIKERTNDAGKLNEELLKGQRVFAVVGICTHLGCIPLWAPSGDSDLQKSHHHCPCHGGIYTPWGDVVGGPPPRPLFIPPQKLEGTKLVIGEPGFIKEFV